MVIKTLKCSINIGITSFLCLLFVASFAQAEELQVGSWGGNVRSGPSTNYISVGGLQNGDPIVLLDKIKSAGADFPWFKISYGAGKTGYHWGGIICGYNRRIKGTFGLCERDNRSTPRTFDCGQQHSMRSLGSKIETKITFIAGQTKNHFKIYWLDYEGNKKFYRTINPETSWTVNTFPSHPWLVIQVSPNGNEKCHSLLRSEKMPSQWLLR